MKYRKNKFDLSLCRYVRRQSKIHPSRLKFSAILKTKLY